MKNIISLIVLGSFLTASLFAQGKGQKTIKKSPKIKKGELEFSNSQNTQDYLDMLEKAFYKVRESYVDSVNESEIIKAGIKGMMTPLDPYTRFLSGSSKDRLDMLRTGKYGGVGIQIGLRRDTLTVLNPFEDSPAYTEGIHSGDQILMIDSVKTKGMTLNDASKLIKGELGSVVELTIFRPSARRKISFELTRSNIIIKHVPYWGVDENGIGYIRVTKFSRNTAKDFGIGLQELIDTDDLKGLIIDLRGNSGGLLSASISMLDKLTDRGLNLLKTNGRIPKSKREMNSRRAPKLPPDVPLAVLINRSSASASEIVSGVIQDLDRGVVIGQKSFGKGLVQSMYNLNDTTTLKVTTAKYYTPSGRLIQKEDYFKKGFLADGFNDEDSLFSTRGGRQVRGGGGISPDINVTQKPLPSYVQGLWRSGVFLAFAAEYVPMNNIQAPIIITEKIYKDFEIFLDEYSIKYKLSGEQDLSKLKKALKKEKDIIEKNTFSLIFWKKKKTAIEVLTKDIDRYFSKKRAGQYWNDNNKKWIENGLLREMSLVSAGEKEKIKVSLYEDVVYKEASEVLLDLNRYFDILEPDVESIDSNSIFKSE